MKQCKPRRQQNKENGLIRRAPPASSTFPGERNRGFRRLRLFSVHSDTPSDHFPEAVLNLNLAASDGRILTVPPSVLVPELVPVTIRAGFFQGTEMPQSCRRPELPR